MNWTGHLTVTLLLCIAAFLIADNFLPSFLPSSLFTLFGLLLIAMASTLVPDLDHPDSKGTQVTDRVFPVAMFAMAGTSIFKNPQVSIDYILPKLHSFFLFALAGIGIFYILKTYFRPSHRGITHTLAANLAYMLLVFFLTGDTLISGAAGFGYLSHLVADQHIKPI